MGTIVCRLISVLSMCLSRFPIAGKDITTTAIVIKEFIVSEIQSAVTMTGSMAALRRTWCQRGSLRILHLDLEVAGERDTGLHLVL